MNLKKLSVRYKTKVTFVKCFLLTLLLSLFLFMVLKAPAHEIKLVVKEQDFTKSIGYVSVRPTLHTQEDYKIPVCFTMAAFTQHGGTENWVKGVIQLIERSPYFYVFGIYSWDLVSDDYKRLLDKHSIYNLINYDEIGLYCSLVLSTAHVPILATGVFKVLVVHGG